MTESAGIPLGRFLALTDVADLLSLSASEVLALVHSGRVAGNPTGGNRPMAH